MCCMMMHAMHPDHDAHQASANSMNEPLLEILKRRYALGEIDKGQFEQTTRILGLSVQEEGIGISGHAEHQIGG